MISYPTRARGITVYLFIYYFFVRVHLFADVSVGGVHTWPAVQLILQSASPAFLLRNYVNRIFPLAGVLPFLSVLFG